MQQPNLNQLQPSVVLPQEYFTSIMGRLEAVERHQQLQKQILRQMGWVRLQEAMKMTGLKSHEGIKAAAIRGELELRYKSEKVIELSLASIYEYLEKKGRVIPL